MSPRYFPQFWYQTRPFSKGLMSGMAAAAATGGVPAATDALFRRMVEQAVRQGVPPKRLLEEGLLAREAMGAQTLAQWELEGSQVWDYAPSLVDALRRSDPGDLMLSDVLPFLERAAYVHFGAQSDWLLDGCAPVEGVLALAPSEGYWRVLLVARAPGAWTSPGPSCFQMLRFRLADMARLPFSAAVDAAVELDLADIDEALPKMTAGPAELGGRAAGLVLKERQRQNAPLYLSALRLLGGALAYAQAYPQDSRFDWQEGTPAKWVSKAQAPGKEGPRAVSKLHGMGYWKVRRIGDEFEASEQAHQLGFAGRSAHWRTGHWRHQAHGPQLSLRKLIWIRPVRVLASMPHANSDTKAPEKH